MRYLAIALFGLFATTGAALACPDYSQTGATYNYTGDQLYSPQSFSVVAGGQNQLRNCNMNYPGYATSAPDFSFYLSGMDPYYLVADVVSSCDSLLLVNTANATWLFDDDSSEGLQPRLEVRGAQNLNGRVDVWVGTYNGSYCDATLNMETWYAQAPAPTPTPAPTPAPAPVPTPAAACPSFASPAPQYYSINGQQLYTPQSYQVTAVGGASLRSCNLQYPGYASQVPQYSFEMSGMDPYYLVADVQASCDTLLLVNTANGTWLFDDDSAGSLQPQLEVRGAQNLNGRVDIWVGTYGNTSCQGTLNMESFYAQAPAPTPTPTPTPMPTPTPTPAGGCPSWQVPGQTYNLTGQQLYSPQRYQVTASGSANLRDCPMEGRGYVNQQPQYSFILSGMEEYGRLEIEVESQCDPTLLVNTPNTTWHFDDDGGGSLQPELNITSGPNLNGRLDVWVGTYNGNSCQATLELETWYN